MGPLTVLYDASCAVCRAVRSWLLRQPRYVELDFVAAGSALARRRFPGLDPAATLQEIHVIDDSGNVYRGAKAWILCLWALRDYRAMSLRFATPERRHLAETFVRWIARNRHRLNAAGDAATPMVDNPHAR